jgi:phosphoenolpyruvate synthase/pyruvate phosphate dikinase
VSFTGQHENFLNVRALSVGVMKMVRCDLASSGVVFTLDTESGFGDAVYMTGAWGLGENIVQGKVDPDAFYATRNLTTPWGSAPALR